MKLPPPRQRNIWFKEPFCTKPIILIGTPKCPNFKYGVSRFPFFFEPPPPPLPKLPPPFPIPTKPKNQWTHDDIALHFCNIIWEYLEVIPPQQPQQPQPQQPKPHYQAYFNGYPLDEEKHMTDLGELAFRGGQPVEYESSDEDELDELDELEAKSQEYESTDEDETDSSEELDELEAKLEQEHKEEKEQKEPQGTQEPDDDIHELSQEIRHFVRNLPADIRNNAASRGIALRRSGLWDRMRRMNEWLFDDNRCYSNNNRNNRNNNHNNNNNNHGDDIDLSDIDEDDDMRSSSGWSSVDSDAPLCDLIRVYENN